MSSYLKEKIMGWKITPTQKIRIVGGISDVENILSVERFINLKFIQLKYFATLPLHPFFEDSEDYFYD